MLNLVSSLNPIIDDCSRVLILGTMPGNESLRKQEYYANPTNQFWRIIYSIFGSAPRQTYKEKILFLHKNRIALWDVIKQCYRAESSDKKISGVIVHDFASLFKKYPNIQCVFFNGDEACKIYKKRVRFAPTPPVVFKILASTSSANTHKTLAAKIEEWRCAFV